MGVKCEYCGTDNGITMYSGKVCKRCGKELGKIKFRKEEQHALYKEKYNICLKLKQFDRAKKWLDKIKELESEGEK
jgi:hypothetical protein